MRCYSQLIFNQMEEKNKKGDLVEIVDGGDYNGLRLKVIQTTYMPNGSMQGGDEPHVLVGLGIEPNGTPLRHTILFINECALQSV